MIYKLLQRLRGTSQTTATPDPSRPLPVIQAREPLMLELEPGRYRWCACGKTATSPWCDDAHGCAERCAEFKPVEFEVRRGGQMHWLCTCKRTRRAPFCDGAHNRIPASAVQPPPSAAD